MPFTWSSLRPDSPSIQQTEPNARPMVPDDEVDMPRWLRPSVRAERFGLDLPHLRRSAARAPDPLLAGDGSASSPPVDLDALFAERRAAIDVPPRATRGPNGRRRVERSPEMGG